MTSRLGDRARLLVDATNAPLFYYTAKNLNPEQLLGVIERKARHLVVPRLPVDFDGRYSSRVPDRPSATLPPVEENASRLRESMSPAVRSSYREKAIEAADGNFVIVNEPIRLGDPGSIDWNDARISNAAQLWRIEFQSFAFLRWLTFGWEDEQSCPSSVASTVEDYVRSWMRTHRIGEENYLRRNWIPHSVSLRILNWCRYLAWRSEADDGSGFAEELSKEIYKNTLFLCNHVEYGVGGNHLVENAAALLTSGLAFGRDDWLETGRRILVRAGRSQFLRDGGHFERSPMYHVQALTRYLTAVDLLGGFGYSVPEGITRTATSGTVFLNSMTPPDGEMPLLNDSVEGYTLSLSDCKSYADRVGVTVDDSADTLAESGYYWLGSGDSRMLIDGGPVGPPHLPGHSHNDMLSVLLWVDGERVFTDTGTFDYEPDERRRYTRSVAAHNTVQVGDVEPIDVGGRYLMGRRTSPDATVKSSDGIRYFEGAYRKASSGPDRYAHRRRAYELDGKWLVWDTVRQRRERPLRSRLHLAPGIEATDHGGHVTLDGTGERALYLYPLDADRTRVSESPYYPEFGTAVPRQKVELRTEGTNESFGFLLAPRELPDVTIERRDDELERVHTGEESYRLPP